MLSGKLSAALRNTESSSPAQELIDLLSWIKLNRQIFHDGGYQPHEIAYFARLNGFNPTLVASVLPHFRELIEGHELDA